MATPKLLVYSVEEDREVVEISSKSTDAFIRIKDTVIGTEVWISRFHIDAIIDVLYDIKEIHHDNN